MTNWGSASTADAVFVFTVGMVGLFLSPFTEVLIARLLPRLGSLPAPRARITTAAVTAIFCAAFAVRFGAGPVLPAFVLFVVVGAQLARIDVCLHLLPNPLVLFLFTGGLLCFLAATIDVQVWPDLLRALAGASILFVIYLILALFSPAGMGMGDVKLAAPVGLYLGYLGWSQLLYGALLGFILNGVVTVLVIALNRKKRVAEVAHGPSMLGAVACVALLLLELSA